MNGWRKAGDSTRRRRRRSTGAMWRAGEGSLDAVGRLVAEGNALVSDSRKSLFAHAGGLADCRARKEALEFEVEKNGAILGELREDYSAEALRADASDKAAGTEEATIEGHLDKVEDALARSWSLADRADAAFREARLLEAAALLQGRGGRTGGL